MLPPISILSSLLLIIFFVIVRHRNKQKKFGVIFTYLIISFAFDVFLAIFYEPKISKSLRFYVFSVFTIVECFLFCYFFYLILRRKAFKRILIAGFVVFLIIAIFSMARGSSSDFDSFCAPVESILIIILAILFFYEQLSEPEYAFVYSSKSFWIIIAFLIYLSSSLFLFVSTAFLSYQEQTAFWPINNVANIVKNILFAIAFSKPMDKLLKQPGSVFSDA